MHVKKKFIGFCDKCDDKAVGVLTNAKYKLSKQSPESYLNERIVSEIDRAMSTLHDKVREAETAMKTMADTNQATNQPTGAAASAPDIGGSSFLKRGGGTRSRIWQWGGQDF